MPETKIRETNITGDSDDAIVRVVIADSDTLEGAHLHIVVSVRSSADPGKPLLVQYQRAALKIAQDAIRAVVNDLEGVMRQHRVDMD